MTTDLSTDVKTLAERIKGKVKETVNASLLELIPEEKWQSLVEEEVRRITQTDLKETVKVEVEKFVRTKLGELLASPDFRGFDPSRGRQVLGDYMMNHLKANIGQIMAEAFSQMVDMEFMRLRNTGRF